NAWDRDFRTRVLPEFVDGYSYELPQQHSRGWLIRPSKEELESLGFEILPPDEGSASVLKLKSTLTRTELFDILQDHFKNGTELDTEEMSPELIKTVESLVRILRNRNGDKLKDFNEKVDEALKPFGITISNRLFGDYPSVFAAGYLRASDAFTS